MPERYPYGQCELDFNFRIKLNRHVARVHRKQEGAETEPYYMKPDVTLSSEEKLQYFDQLKNKFDELTGKYNSYEKRFDYLQTRLKTLTQHRNKPKKKQVKNFRGSANTSGSYEDIENDSTIPSGWKSSYKTLDVFGRHSRHTIYWAPNGRFCTSRREALNYMIDLNSSKEDMEIMKNGLLTDGWTEDSSLPVGWLSRASEKDLKNGQLSASRQFITPDFQLCKNAKLTTKHLLMNNSEDELSKFISAHFLKNEVTPSNVSWLTNDSIPYPWKAATTTSDLGSKGLVLVSPDGVVHTNVKTALEITEKAGEMSAVDVEKFYSFLGDVKYREEIAHRDWIKDKSLPEGWMKLNKPGHAYYMSPKGENFGTRVGVLEHLKKADSNFDEKPFIGSVAKKIDLVWKEDDTAPIGWTSAINEESEYANGRRYKDPNGKYFFNRIEVLKYMTKENALEEDIDIMKKGLLSDGWTDENLPDGWVVKKKTYLSPTFEMIYSMEMVIAKMREGGVIEEAVKKVKENSILKWQSKEYLPEGWMVSFNIGKSWIKHYMDPSGKFYLCLPQALKQLSLVGDQTLLDKMRLILFEEESWESADFLPTNWLLKRKHDNRFMFLSPTYERFKNTKVLIKHMKENNFKQEDVIKFQRQLKTLFVEPKNDSAVNEAPSNKAPSNEVSQRISTLNWIEDESLPDGWKVAQTDLSNGSSSGTKIKRFLSPKGDYYGNRGDAFKSLLMDASSEQEDIEKMKAGLFEDGWESAEFMPENWLRKVDKRGKPTYLTPTGEQMHTLEKVLNYMKDNGYAIEEMDIFKENSFSTKYVDDETLPTGWKCGLASIKSGFTVKRYLSPEGKLFNNRASAMKYMLEKKFNSEDVIKMKKGFELDGWTYNENLPEGWKMKQRIRRGKVQYLTPSYDTIDGAKSLVSHLETNNYSREQIIKIKRFMKNNRMDKQKNMDFEKGKNNVQSSISKNIQSLLPSVTFSKIGVENTKEIKKEKESKFGKGNLNWKSDNSLPNEIKKEKELEFGKGNLDWKNNDSLPNGWKTALMAFSLKHSKSKQVRKFLSSDGKFLNSRAQCLRYMLEKNGDFRKKDFEKMKRSLPKDGWRQNDCLPENWMYRTVGKVNLFLNPKFEQIKSFISAKKYMEKCSYDSQTIEKVRKGFYRVSKDIVASICVPILENVKAAEEVKGSSDQDLDDSSNDSFLNVKNNLQSSKLEWMENKTLPKGWKCAFIPSALKHQAEGSKIMKLMSPTGKYLNSKVQALKFMSENKKTFSLKDIEQMITSLTEDSWVVDNNLPKGWMSKSIQHAHMFMTPEFDTLRSQRKALAYMEEKGYNDSTIQKAKASFRLFGGNQSLKVDVESKSSSTMSIKLEKSSSPIKRKISEIDNGTTKKLLESNTTAPLKKQKWNKFTKGKHDQDWLEGGETLPAGWKIRIEKKTNSNQMLSPSGNVFSSRADALKYMVSNPESYSDLEVTEMKAKLHHENWEDNTLLPHEWKLKKLVGGVVIFLSERGSCMRTVKGARDNLKRNDTSALEKFRVLVEELKPTNRNFEIKNDSTGVLDPLSLGVLKQVPDLSLVKKEKADNHEESGIKKEKKGNREETENKVQVKSEPVSESEEINSSLPPNWSIQTSSDGTETLITSSQGKTFSSRLSAVEFLIKSKSDPQTIYNIWNTLDAEGWIIGDELLPPGWRVKFHKSIFDYKYLTREMSVIHSTEVALKLVTDSEDYTSENLRNFKQWSGEISKSKPKITWRNEASLPEGWMLSSGLHNEIIKDTKGALFDGRKEAIDHMIKEHYSPSNIFSLWNTLHLEGWVSDEDNLPTGWKRKFFSDLKKHHYLSPMMDVVKSTEALLDIVENGKEYTNEEVKKVKQWQKVNE